MSGLFDYQPSCSPGDAIVDLYGDGSQVMCVPADTANSIVAGGGKILGTTANQPPQRVTQPGQYYNAGNLGTVNVSAGPTDTNTYVLVGAAAILFFFMLKRR